MDPQYIGATCASLSPPERSSINRDDGSGLCLSTTQSSGRGRAAKQGHQKEGGKAKRGDMSPRGYCALGGSPWVAEELPACRRKNIDEKMKSIIYEMSRTYVI